MEIATELWGNDKDNEYIGGPLAKGAIFKRLTTERKILKLYNVQSWPLFLSKTKAFIGCGGLRPHNMGERAYDLDIQIRSKYRRKGYATEAALAILDHAFGTLGAKAVYASHNPHDTAAGKFLEKLGFEYSHDEYCSLTKLQHHVLVLKK